ncbi:hypothetical protein ACSNOI_30270 [Actinomadura kijaniata]|uniref:hypothetical protein n=1 Tax=Actinomadura kijaniata TaxID=46161 RepID=UPI003F1C0BB7
MEGRRRHAVAALTGLVLGLLAIGPGLGPGFVLSFDMVFVPDPAFTRMTFGLTGTAPRHVPSDALVAALGAVLPGAAVQKLLLLAVFVMACVSAASLVPSRRTLPRLAAGVCYAWNPFVAERLLLGHWAFLLGYAALPWAVGAAARVTGNGGGRRLLRTLLPAAAGGFAAMAISGLAALTVAPFTAARRVRALAAVAGALVLLSLPWLVTGWLRPSGMPGDTGAVEAFAARADTPFGALGSLLLLGGAWNRETVPPAYGTPLLATAWALVVVAAIAAFARWCRAPWARGLAVAAAVGYALAAWGAVAPDSLRAAIALWPGFAVFRDGQQYVAPLAVLIAVGFGTLVDRATRPAPEPPGHTENDRDDRPAPSPSAGAEAGPGGRDARVDRVRSGDHVAGVVLGVFAVVVPVVLLPGLGWGAMGRLDAVQYPDDWIAARRIVQADPVAGDVLVLPWATYRSYPWNGGRTSLDALPRYLTRRVVVSDSVVIGDVTVPAEDPRARELDRIVRGSGPVVDGLRAAGVRYVALDAETGGPARRRLAGAETVVDGADLVLFRIDRPARGHRDGGAPTGLAVAAWAFFLAGVFWSFSTPPITLIPHTPRIPRRTRTP